MTASRKTQPLPMASAIQAPMAAGTPARVIRKLNSPAAAMMNMMMEEDRTDFFRIGPRSRQPMARYTPMPTTSA